MRNRAEETQGPMELLHDTWSKQGGQGGLLEEVAWRGQRALCSGKGLKETEPNWAAGQGQIWASQNDQQ